MRLCIMFISVVLLMTAGLGSGYAHVVDQPQQDIPSYAKWGRLAMKETKSRYPDADIIDYLHQGREDQEDATVEKFKLWLREDSREFGVFIDIAFDSETEKVRNISFEETSR
ncbi:YqzG/YhdC family protein [Lentibacillus salinarum]|uniref:YqzG/YhdC family protein n=1 Tax=Lentibacillus salinarum TaxID=446820 RepID=A0ABW3ZSM2_9BACI